jgi:glycine hydroxymethyltransferase
MFSNRLLIKDVDPELQRALDGERQRQEDHIELIASENYASPRVLEAQGSVLTNKYAEGYPGKRYYGGCEFVDIAEQLAIDRAKKLFGADYANVQPHSGSQANAAVYLALLAPGDVILGMSLDHGGHLTHGAKVNFSGKLFHAFQYGVHPDTGLIDYEQIEALALEHKPKMIVAGFSAYSRVLDWARFRAIADKVGRAAVRRHGACRRPGGRRGISQPAAARRRGDDHHPQDAARAARRHDPGARQRCHHQEAQFDGVSRHAGRSADARDRRQGGGAAGGAAAGIQALSAPGGGQCARHVRALVARGYGIVSGGTDNHLFLLSLVGRDITGKDADAALGRAHITVNKNAVPNDPRPPMIASGLRLGTPAATTRGFKEPEIRRSPAGSPTSSMPAAPRARSNACGRRWSSCAALPGLRRIEVLTRAVDALSLLRPRRDQGNRLAAGRRGRPDPPPARVPELRRALHDLRDRRTADAARDQERRQPRAVR